MKKILIAIGLLFCSGAFSQTHDVSINIAPMIVSNFSGAYFYNFNDDMGVGSVVGYQNLKIADLSYTSFYVAPEFRFYFDAYENDGYYAGGYMKFRSAKSDDNWGFENDEEVNYSISATGLALGLNVGRVWDTKSGFFFNPWSGFGFFVFDKVKYSNGYDPIDDEITNLPGIDFRVGVSIGWRF